MKDYLIESMSSYMGKMEKSMPKRKKLNESLKEELSFQDWLDKTFYPGFDPTDLSDEEYYELEDEYNSTKDLTEARNPENDEVNAAIRRYLNSDKAYIPKKDRDLFDKYGITPDKLPRRYGSEKIVKGKGGRDGLEVIGADTIPNFHPDYDYANSLTKKKLSGGDIEQPTNDIRYYSRMFGYQPTGRDSKDTSKLSWNQFKSLQPYADEKQQISDAGGRIKREKEDLEKRIQAQKDASQRTIDYENKNKENAVKKAKAQHAKKKANESLSLKEDTSIPPVPYEDLYDEIYEYCENELIGFESQMPCQDIAIKIPGYDCEWCAWDAYEDASQVVEAARNSYADALTKAYLAHYPR